MTRASRMTSHDVASRAGVSQATVSLVLSRNPRARIATTTRERVLQAAAELGYRPNLLARGLVHRRSFALGVVVPSLDPFYTDVVSGVQRVAAEEGYAVLLCEAVGGLAAQQVDLLRGWSVDGLIMDAIGAASLAADAAEGLNLILVDEPSDRWPWVASDSEAAGRLAAEHLLSLGHREIAFVGPATDCHVFRMRERGFVAELRRHGVTLTSERLRRVQPSVSGGERGMRALLSLRSRPTAVFFANDLMALGGLRTSLAAKVQVPGEMSLMGCDDIEMARVVTPELSTIAIHARELGARAARLAIRGAQGETVQNSSRRLPVKLVKRGSTSNVRPS